MAPPQESRDAESGLGLRAVLSYQGHEPIVDLMLVKSWEEYRDGRASIMEEAVHRWSIFQRKMREKWLLKMGPGAPIRGPLLYTNDEALDDLFEMFANLFFEDELANDIEYDWYDEFDTTTRGYTHFNEELPNTMITIVKAYTTSGFYEGQAAIEVMSTLLHEMVHAYIERKLCRCDECSLEEDRDGLTGHGNVYQYLTGLLQEVVNDLFGDFGDWDLD
ncbi:MAG: hypothetical protein Q9218_000379 [Villophora microphyllina]